MSLSSLKTRLLCARPEPRSRFPVPRSTGKPRPAGVAVQCPGDTEISDWPHWAPTATGASRTLPEQRRCHTPEGSGSTLEPSPRQRAAAYAAEGREGLRSTEHSSRHRPAAAGAANSWGGGGGACTGLRGQARGSHLAPSCKGGALGDNCPTPTAAVSSANQNVLSRRRCGGLLPTVTHAACYPQTGRRCRGPPVFLSAAQRGEQGPRLQSRSAPRLGLLASLEPRGELPHSLAWAGGSPLGGCGGAHG